jgi:hypothetical protein
VNCSASPYNVKRPARKFLESEFALSTAFPVPARDSPIERFAGVDVELGSKNVAQLRAGELKKAPLDKNTLPGAVHHNPSPSMTIHEKFARNGSAVLRCANERFMSNR